MKTIKSITEAEIAEYPNLPAGWQWARLGEIADNIQYGYAESSTDEPIGPRFLRITDIQNNEVIWKSIPYCKIDDAKKQNYLLKYGDLVFARTGATVGKSYLLKGDFPESVFASYLIRVRLLKEISESFVYNFFQSLIYWKQITEGQVGIGQPNVNGTKLSLLIVPVAPLPEQRAIVSKIEQLFSELDNGISNLKLAQEQLKVYRQAVLKEAFEGELTKKWREQQTDLPAAEDLLEQIRKEREETAKVSGKKVRSANPLTEKELVELLKLPEGWRWVKIGQVSKVGTGVTPLKKRRDFYENGTIPWVTSGALNESYVKLASGYVTELALKETNLKIYPKRTLLIALYGEGKTRGKCSELLIEATTNQAIAAIVQEGTEEEVRPYLKWFLMKNYNEIRIKSSGGVQPNLNLGIIENTSFPLCSLPEQQAIVQEIETRLSVCDKIEQDIEKNLEKAEALRQSILKKAFEGKLLNERELAEVRKAEDWEPAEVLLERIKAEKAGNVKKEKQATEQLKNIIQDDKGLTSQVTLQAFEQIDK